LGIRVDRESCAHFFHHIAPTVVRGCEFQVQARQITVRGFIFDPQVRKRNLPAHNPEIMLFGDLSFPLGGVLVWAGLPELLIQPLPELVVEDDAQIFAAALGDLASGFLIEAIEIGTRPVLAMNSYPDLVNVRSCRGEASS
jgi:hypothetical protein